MEVAPLPSSLRAVVLQLGLLPSSLGRSALLALLRRALAPSLRAPPSRRPLHAMAAAPRVACSTVPSSLALALPSAMDVVGLDSLWLRHPSCSLLRPIRLGSTMARRGRVEMWRIEESLRVLPALRCRGPSLGCAQLQLRALSLVARVLASLSCARSTSSMASRPSCPPARPLGSLGLNLHRAALLPLSLLHCRQLPVSPQSPSRRAPPPVPATLSATPCFPGVARALGPCESTLVRQRHPCRLCNACTRLSTSLAARSLRVSSSTSRHRNSIMSVCVWKNGVDGEESEARVVLAFIWCGIGAMVEEENEVRKRRLS
jgi:hypothetical protein